MKIMKKNNQSHSVGLFVTCLVDVMRPSIGFASLKLLEDAGCKVTVPEQQTCSGQTAYNSGDDVGAAKVAKQLIMQFEAFDYVVIPSGSCSSMIKVHFQELFQDDAEWLARSKALSAKTYELLSFLVDVCEFAPEKIELQTDYTYHHSCSGLRDMKVNIQPKKLLNRVEGLNHIELKGSTECCGFGGTFCVKYSDISNQIVEEKSENIRATGATLLLGGDWGCLMNMSGKLNRDRRDSHNETEEPQVVAMHTAEVLAGMADEFIDNSQ
jgi:L-lactate dehydrogenase complex protein LldE